MAASLRAYLKGRPLLANCITYGALYMGAEFSQQTLLRKVLPEKKQDYDMALVGRYGVLGSTVFPTILYYWYKALDARLIGTSPQIVVAKALIDQAFSSPIILGVFFTGMSAMEGRADWFKELKEKFVKSYTFSCCFWLPAQCLNFFLVPNAFRVVYTGCASFFWVNVLCLLKRGNSDIEEEKKD